MLARPRPVPVERGVFVLVPGFLLLSLSLLSLRCNVFVAFSLLGAERGRGREREIAWLDPFELTYDGVSRRRFAGVAPLSGWIPWQVPMARCQGVESRFCS